MKEMDMLGSIHFVQNGQFFKSPLYFHSYKSNTNKKKHMNMLTFFNLLVKHYISLLLSHMHVSIFFFL